MRLPSFPPLWASGRWWRLYAAAMGRGEGREGAIAAANRECGMKPREWMRFEVAGGTTLSLPVSGGASALKNHPASSWTVAPEAIRDTRKLQATLATLYGRTPFYTLLASDLFPPENQAESKEAGLPTAEATCRGAFRRIEEILRIDETVKEYVALPSDKRSRLRAIGAEKALQFQPHLSIIDAVATLGRDAIFPLLPAF